MNVLYSTVRMLVTPFIAFRERHSHLQDHELGCRNEVLGGRYEQIRTVSVTHCSRRKIMSQLALINYRGDTMFFVDMFSLTAVIVCFSCCFGNLYKEVFVWIPSDRKKGRPRKGWHQGIQ
jgi:hypothetical protein